jgi:hypothetical protein
MSSLRIRTFGPYLIALVALFLALTGTSIALPGKNSVNSGDIKNKTIKAVDVGHNALNGNQIAEQKLSAVRLATSAEEARNVLWAAVKNPNGAGNAAILRAGQANTGAAEGNDLVNVVFGRDVSSCSWTGTSQAAGTVQTSATPGVGSSITVRTRNTAGQLDDQPFSVQVVC